MKREQVSYGQLITMPFDSEEKNEHVILLPSFKERSPVIPSSDSGGNPQQQQQQQQQCFFPEKNAQGEDSSSSSSRRRDYPLPESSSPVKMSENRSAKLLTKKSSFMLELECIRNEIAEYEQIAAS